MGRTRGKMAIREAVICHNIGYQGRSLDGFCAALVGAGVRTLIDVRERAWSQRPEFRKTALASALNAHGIAYTHRRDAGNPFRPRPGTKLDAAQCAKAYAAFLAGHPEVVDSLDVLVSSGGTALLCYEARRDECHRGVLLDALTRRNRHLTTVDL